MEESLKYKTNESIVMSFLKRGVGFVPSEDYFSSCVQDELRREDAGR